MAGEEHKKLVARAGRWLRGTAKCTVVLEEPICPQISEEPDAIGWRDGGRESIVIECKVSRADFLRDKKKYASRRGRRMGAHRYYMAPVGLLTAADMPEGWGSWRSKATRCSRRRSRWKDGPPSLSTPSAI